MNKKLVFEYKDYTIKINRVPQQQEIFDLGGCGWVFDVSLTGSNIQSFMAIIKSLNADPTETNLVHVLELGKNVVYSLIDKGKVEKTHYCYRWEPNEVENSLKRVDCEEISPGGYLTPLR